MSLAVASSRLSGAWSACAQPRTSWSWTWRRSSRKCTVMPSAPPRRHAWAASSGSGSVVFRAGESILLGEGFSVATGAALTMVIGPPFRGDGYVRDDNPDAEGEYVVRFYIDPDGLTLSSASEQFHHFIAYDADGDREFLIGVTYNDVMLERRLFATAFETAGTERTTKSLCELQLGSGWQYVEAHWKASTGTDGDLQVSINGGAAQSLARCLADIFTQ